MDEELKQLAALALRNAFYEDFSSLVNEYLKAAKGLDTEAQERQMGELTSIYGRNTSAEDPEVAVLDIWTRNDRGGYDTSGHETLLEALEYLRAREVYLRGKLVFNRVKGKWKFVG